MSEVEHLELVSKGELTEVYRGVYLPTAGVRKSAAIKRLRADRRQDESAKQLFVNESHIAMQLDSPHCLGCLGCGHDESGPWLAYHWVDGFTVAALTAKDGLSLDELIYVGSGVVSALQYLHQQNCIHRDVNPSNIFVDVDGRVRLGDFGLALWPNRPKVPLDAPGTPGHTAPEQLEGRAELASDLFSLGSTLASLSAQDDPPLATVLEQLTSDDPASRPSLETVRSVLALAGERFAEGEARLADRLRQMTAPPKQLDGAVLGLLGGISHATASPVAPEARRLPPDVAHSPPVETARPASSWLPTMLAALLVVGTVVTLGVVIQSRLGARQTLPEATTDTGSTQVAEPKVEAPITPAPLSTAAVTTPRDKEPKRGPQVGGLPSATTPKGRGQSKPHLTKSDVEPPAQRVLLLNAIPWAKVTIDGVARGHTPVRLKLPLGIHQFSLVHPPSGASKNLSVDLKEAGANTFIVNMSSGKVKKSSRD